MPSAPLKPDDVLSHFLFYRSDINFAERKIKTSVLSKPYPNGCSVFLTTGQPHEQIWQVAKEYVVPSYSKQNRPMVGRFDIESSYYHEAGLDIELSEPPPKHYNLHGMPITASIEQGKQLSHRQQIVAQSQLYLIADNEDWAQYSL